MDDEVIFLFFTGVIFNSLMRPGLRFWLERQPIGLVYLAPGVGYTGLCWILGWQWPLHHMQHEGGQSARETFLYYGSLSEMQEDWDDVCASVWQASSPPSRSMPIGQGVTNVSVWWASGILSGFTLVGQGCPQCVSSMDVWLPIQSSVQVHAFDVLMLIWHTLQLQLG